MLTPSIGRLLFAALPSRSCYHFSQQPTTSMQSLLHAVYRAQNASDFRKPRATGTVLTSGIHNRRWKSGCSCTTHARSWTLVTQCSWYSRGPIASPSQLLKISVHMNLRQVLGKKTRQISLLHVWHHGSIVPLFAFYLSTGRGGGFIAALPLWNSLIHVVRTHTLWKPAFATHVSCENALMVCICS
eukprot:SAG31_NODE_7070_length_1797_cov_1.568905_2_plen_186_part_00